MGQRWDNFTLDDELALYLSAEVRGHPYYIKCCVESQEPNKNFDSTKGIDRIIDYEVTRGAIYAFWETHFEENRALINQDNDEALGKK